LCNFPKKSRKIANNPREENSPNPITLLPSFFGINLLSKRIFNEMQLQRRRSSQGCQMVYFQTKNPNLAKF
jgi:hypothetical protein